MRRGCARSCELFSQFAMAIFNLLVSSARALSAPVFSFKKQPHISKDMAAHFPILRPEVLEACHNLPLNLTVFGPRGTNWSVSWTSGKHNPPFRTEDDVFSIVLKKGKEDEKNILCRAFNGISRSFILCSKLQTTVVFCDQVRYRNDKISELMNGSPFFSERMHTAKCARCKIRQTYVTERTYGVCVSLACSLRFSSSNASARRFNAATVSGIVRKRSSLELPVTKLLLAWAEQMIWANVILEQNYQSIASISGKHKGISWISPLTCEELTWKVNPSFFLSFHIVRILQYCDLLQVQILDFTNTKLGL